MPKRQWCQFNLRMLLFLTAALGLILALVIPPLARDRSYGFSKFNVLNLPNAELAEEAERLDFTYQISSDITVNVKGWVAEPGDPSLKRHLGLLEPTDALFMVSVTRNPRILRLAMPYSRAEFEASLETEVNRRLGIAEGAQVAKLTLAPYYAGR